MVLTSSVPIIDSSLSASSGQRWPIARCSVSWGRGRLIPTVRCVLVNSDQYVTRLGTPAGPAGSAGPRPRWGTAISWVARTKALAVALADTHKAWSSQSMQTLQRVGSMIRSTSIDCLAALGKKGALSADQQLQEPPGGNGDDQDEETLVRASLSRFLTTASNTEVSQAARMAELSDMAYDVGACTPERLHQAHGLTLVANSLSSGQGSLGATGSPPALEQQGHSQLLQDVIDQHLLQQQAPVHQAAWPMPLVLLQPAGSAPMPSTDASGLPSSPRTPFVLSSFAEDEMLLGGEYQPVTASGYLAEPGSPRRPSAAAASAAAAAGGGMAVASMGMPAAPAMGGMPAMYLQPVPARQHVSEPGLWYDTQHMHEDAHLSLDEAALLQQLKQQEALVLLEMQASQQMMFLLQQSQQQQLLLHQQDSGAAAVAAAEDLQQLQGLAALTSSTVAAAASTAAAAALAGASVIDPSTDPAFSTSPGGAAADIAAGAPADWFCCDGPLSEQDPTPTRFFAIQGSITLDHWRINLTIDPCEFEAGALGPIKVHRGMYEAALSMYDTILPHVQQHLAQHPEGKVALTGHSLGGSLATLLMLLMVHRGDISVANVATVYTFGSPAVFCEGANGSPPTPGACHACSLPCEHRKAHASSSSSSATDSLLSKLGLAADAVVNVIMTRDIVPRAFVCDYTLVAGVLKSWLPSFKEHRGLAACKEHKALYNFVGVVEVLQPHTDCDFVLPDEAHDMLPPGAALYKLTEPQQQQQQPQPTASRGSSEGGSTGTQSRLGSFNSLSSLAGISNMSLSSALAELTSSFSLGGGSSGGARPLDDADSGAGCGLVAVPVAAASGPGPAGLTAAAAEAVTQAVSPGDSLDAVALTGNTKTTPARAAPAAAAAVRSPAGGSSGGSVGGRRSSESLTLGDAILTFMNSPHPLQTLGEMRAYGHNGSISRYHNPASYTKALQRLGTTE